MCVCMFGKDVDVDFLISSMLSIILVHQRQGGPKLADTGYLDMESRSNQKICHLVCLLDLTAGI